MKWLQTVFVGAIRLYQVVFSPVLTTLFGPLGFGCRFTPTCSHYALEAIRLHGPFRGGWLALRRLGRCHPWGDAGHDPVPPAPHVHPHRTPQINRQTAEHLPQSPRC